MSLRGLRMTRLIETYRDGAMVAVEAQIRAEMRSKAAAGGGPGDEAG